jgi:hypothetical protein
MMKRTQGKASRRARAWYEGAASIAARLAGGALIFAAGCASGEADDDVERAAVDEGPDEVRLYFTEADAGGEPVVRERRIDRRQAREIIDARAERRDIRWFGPAGGGLEPQTVGSIDWASACQFYDWTLITSASNGGGDLFCARASSNFAAVVTPFVPRYIDLSVTHHTDLCTGDNGGCFHFTCGGTGNQVWRTFGLGFHTENLSPPSNVRYIGIGHDGPC